VSFLKHSSNVYDGSNSSRCFCSMHGEGLESVEVGVEYQASYSCLFGTLSILFYFIIIFLKIYLIGQCGKTLLIYDGFWYIDLKIRASSTCVVGSSGFGTNGDFHCLVRTHERPFVCLCLQPSNACFSCRHGLFATRRKVAPWKVYISLLSYIYISIIYIYIYIYMILFSNDSILGAVLIVCGLYAVLWSKGKEMKKITQLAPSNSSRESDELMDIVIASPMEGNVNVIASVKPDSLSTSNAPIQGNPLAKGHNQENEENLSNSKSC
jgi:hypothetical protein